MNIDRLMALIERCDQSDDAAARALAAAIRGPIEHGRPVVSRSELRQWRLERRQYYLRVAHHHAQGRSTEARLQALQHEIRRMRAGDLAALGHGTAIESKMRAAIRAAEQHGAVVLGDRAMRRLLTLDVDANENDQDLRASRRLSFPRPPRRSTHDR